MRDLNRRMFIAFVIICIFSPGCSVPGTVVGSFCQTVEARGGSPAPGLCPAAGASADPDYVILPQPGSSVGIVVIGGNGSSSAPAMVTCDFVRRVAAVGKKQARSTCVDGSTAPPVAPVPGSSAASSGLGALQVVGPNLVNASGQQIVLHGVNKEGTEYSCIHGVGIFDPPGSDSSAVVQAIKAWTGVNAVRIPLNEDCWLAVNGAPAAYSGASYQSAIRNFVLLLVQNNLVPILDLHWSAPGTQQATNEQPMPDQDHSVAFWSQVATMFKNNGSVIFDLFNEPYPDNGQDTAAAWTCWKSGGTCSGVSYQVAGMQELITTVRAAGAKNVLMLGGIEYSNVLTQWTSYEPSDPLNNLAASWHMYGGNTCVDVSCWNQAPAQAATKVPLIAGEFGETFTCTDPSTTLDGTFMNWMDAKKLSYLAWDWDATGNGDTCSLVTDEATGAPTPTWGAFYKAHVAQFGAQ